MGKLGRKGSADKKATSEEQSKNAGSYQFARVNEEKGLEVPSISEWEVLFLWKDTAIVFAGAFGFYFVYFAFLLVLSSLVDPRLVSIMQTVNYTTQTVTSLFVPAYLVRRWGSKWTLAIWLCGVIPVALAQFWPMATTFIPAAMIMALASNTVAVSSCQYLTDVVVKLIKIQGGRLDLGLALLLSLYTAVSRGGGWVLGALLPHLILGDDDHADFELLPVMSCGANFCAHHVDAHPREPKTGDGRLLLFSLYTASAFFGPILVSLFLKKRKGAHKNAPPRTVREQFKASFQSLRTIGLPLNISCIFTGYLLTFAASDFTEAFVVCVFGTAMVSPVATAFSASFVVASLLAGPFVRFIGLSGCLHSINTVVIAILVMLIAYTPTQLVVILIVTGGLGATCSIHMALDGTLCGLALAGDQELGYSVQQFLLAVGGAVGFATATRVCVYLKLILALALVVLASVLFCYCDLRERRAKNTEVAPFAPKPQ